ncbi:hypothetical protein, partial [Pseudoneobacillus sp. C159]
RFVKGPGHRPVDSNRGETAQEVASPRPTAVCHHTEVCSYLHTATATTRRRAIPTLHRPGCVYAYPSR